MKRGTGLNLKLLSRPRASTVALGGALLAVAAGCSSGADGEGAERTSNAPIATPAKTNPSELSTTIDPMIAVGWKEFPGPCTAPIAAIAVAPDETPWVVGCGSEGGGGSGIYHWNGDGWTQYPGAATRVAVSGNGTPWVVNAQNEIFEWNGSSWAMQSGRATEIAGGPGDSVWVIGSSSTGGNGNGIYARTGNGWMQYPGSATQIAVSATGAPWLTNKQHTIYEWTGHGFTPLPGAGSSIGVGLTADAFVIGTTLLGGGGYGIYNWSGSWWSQLPGAAVLVAVNEEGYPWVVNAQGNIYEYGVGGIPGGSSGGSSGSGSGSSGSGSSGSGSGSGGQGGECGGDGEVACYGGTCETGLCMGGGYCNPPDCDYDCIDDDECCQVYCGGETSDLKGRTPLAAAPGGTSVLAPN